MNSSILTHFTSSHYDAFCKKVGGIDLNSRFAHIPKDINKIISAYIFPDEFILPSEVNPKYNNKIKLLNPKVLPFLIKAVGLIGFAALGLYTTYLYSSVIAKVGAIGLSFLASGAVYKTLQKAYLIEKIDRKDLSILYDLKSDLLFYKEEFLKRRVIVDSGSIFYDGSKIITTKDQIEPDDQAFLKKISAKIQKSFNACPEVTCIKEEADSRFNFKYGHLYRALLNPDFKPIGHNDSLFSFWILAERNLDEVFEAIQEKIDRLENGCKIRFF